MAQIQQQLTFALREVAITLMQTQGITEGKWLMGFEFEFGAGNLGLNNEIKPTGIVGIKNVVLTRQPDDAPDDLPIIIDASKLTAVSARADTGSKADTSSKKRAG
jgi:hypothetical protein